MGALSWEPRFLMTELIGVRSGARWMPDRWASGTLKGASVIGPRPWATSKLQDLGPAVQSKCSESHALPRAAEARASQASWTTSASSSRVSSPIRLARTSTDG